MAVIKLSGLITQISGKVGGSVFCKTKNGQIVKNNSFSLPQNSPAQSIAQTKIQTVSSRWLLLTPGEKSAWSAEAVNYPYLNKVGETSIYNGYQLFLKLNNNLLVATLPVNISVPEFEAVAFMPRYGWAMGRSYCEVLLKDAVVGQTIVFYISKGVAESVNGDNLIYTEFASKLISVGDEFFSLQTDFSNKFPRAILGTYYWMKYRIIATNSGNSTNFSTPKREGIFA
jgi:hypothetical protein